MGETKILQPAFFNPIHDARAPIAQSSRQDLSNSAVQNTGTQSLEQLASTLQTQRSSSANLPLTKKSAPDLSEIVQPTFPKKAEKNPGLNALHSLYHMVTHSETRIQDYVGSIDGRREKINCIEKFKQHLRSAGDSIDWCGHDDKCAMIEQARAHGMVIPEGDPIWTKDQIAALLANADSTTEPLLSSNDKDKVMLGWFQNKKTEWLTTITNMIKQAHDDIMAVIRNLSSR